METKFEEMVQLLQLAIELIEQRLALMEKDVRFLKMLSGDTSLEE